MDRSNDLEFMKEYLFNAMTFEKYVYTWSNALNSANNIVAMNSNQKDKEKSYLEKIELDLSGLESKYSKGRAETRSNIPKAIILWPLTIFLAFLYMFCLKNDHMFSCILIAIAFFVSLICASGYSSGWSKHSEKNEIKEKERLLDEKSRVTAFYYKYDEKTNLATAERIKIENNLNEVQSTLEDLYSQNVLPECYRNFVAVATMYQYIVTGRCACVKGHGGIYDTYEKDLRMNLIITNLQRINEKLDRIIENQNMLYRQMREANENLSLINKELKDISEKTSNIERSSAMSALAQHQTAAILDYNSSKHW
ncbi:MAG: hypothetical protein IJN38_05020 [Clostridia bacterium]|nr:hypothetical protein [Clostridia bacterium]